MLAVQSYLRKFSNPDEALESLEREFAIKATLSPYDDRIILNYNMIDSPKTNEIVRECRGLVLDKNNGWNLIARAFTRFFNHCETEHLEFDWVNKVEASEKEDGSLILYYYYNGEWRVNTKGSFGQGIINDSGHTWTSLFNECLAKVESLYLVPAFTYVFELCSIHNKVVRHYPSPQIYLLTSFDSLGGEIDMNDEILAGYFNVFERPKSFIINSLDEAIEYIKAKESLDATYEGLVLCDSHGNRIKVKSASYLMLHRSANNGHVSWEQIYNQCLTDDGGQEFLSYFDSYTERFDKMREFIKNSKEEILTLYSQVKDIEGQKEFAMRVKDNKFAAILFAFRKGGETIDELMISRASIFLRIFDLT